MEDSKDGLLPLVGRVIKKRLGDVKDEAQRELREGFDEFGRELREELQEGEAPAAPTRIQIEED